MTYGQSPENERARIQTLAIRKQLSFCRPATPGEIFAAAATKLIELLLLVVIPVGAVNHKEIFVSFVVTLNEGPKAALGAVWKGALMEFDNKSCGFVKAVTADRSGEPCRRGDIPNTMQIRNAMKTIWGEK